MTPLFTLIFAFVLVADKTQAHTPVKFPNTFDILQDKQGFIWTASHNGLNRYDSENIITFANNNENWPLPFNWINDISLLENNTLLLATETNKLWQFNTVTGKAHPIEVDIHKDSVYHVIEHLHHYYLHVPDKLYRVNPITTETTVIAENIRIQYLKSTDKNLYVASKNKLFQLKNNQLNLILKQYVTAMTTTRHSLIAATDKELFVINDQEQYRSIPIKHPIQAIAQESGQENFFTIDNKGNITKYSIENLNILPHPYPKAKTVYTRTMMHDSSGVLWLMTNQGVNQLTPTFTKDHHLVFDVTINVISLATLNNELIIGSYGQGLSARSKEHPILSPHINASFTPRAKIISHLITVDNDLYIATFDGLWRYNLLTNQVARVNFSGNTHLLLDMTLKGNLLYLATNSDGFLIYNIEENRVIQHISGNRLSASETINILPLDDGNIWLANANGVDIYNTHSDSVKTLDIPGQNKVISLVEHQNKIFIATKGDGIFVYNRQGELLSHIAKNISFSYMKLINGTIWAPGQPGFYQISPKNYQVTMVPNTQQYSFTDNPIVHNNSIYTGHFGGMLEIPLTQTKTFNPKVYISKTTVSGKSHLLNKSIHVQSSNDVITLELASLDYRPGQNKTYQYKINNGLWNQVNDHHLTLTGLASGIYHIEIMATNSLGQWSENKAYTDIYVDYPWYWSPNIKVLYGFTLICLISMIFWLVYLRTRSISYIHQLLKSDLKTRGKNALNVIRNISLAIEFIEKKEPIAKIENILKQSINELSYSEKNKAPDSLYGNSLMVALPFLSEYVHKKHHINLNTQIDIEEDKLSYEMQADVYKIIYEAITSAIHNSNGRNFKVSIQDFKEKLWLTISDDSHSFANFNNKINFDMAMYYIRQIANKYKASVNTFDEQTKGSQLVISIPLMDLN